MDQIAKELGEISGHEAELIFDKLIAEEIPVTAWLTSAGGASVFLFGLLEWFSSEQGFFVRAHPTELEVDSFLMVSVNEQRSSYSYCDERELKDVPQDIKDTIGSSAVQARFLAPLETLILIFRL